MMSVTVILAVSSKGSSTRHISRAELGQIAATPRLEIQLADAVEQAILRRAAVIRDMNRDLRRCRGRLLEVNGDECYESAYGSFHRPLTFCAVWQS